MSMRSSERMLEKVVLHFKLLLESCAVHNVLQRHFCEMCFLWYSLHSFGRVVTWNVMKQPVLEEQDL